jgi:hypothetical protein
MTDYSRNRLGKLKPINAPSLMLADVLTGTTPAVPALADHFTGVADWEMGGNDQFGTCGPTSVANMVRLITRGLTGTMQAVALDDVYDLYRRSGNPGFNPDLTWDDPKQEDNGVILQKMLGALLAGGIGGRKPVAYAKVAPGDMDTLDKAVAIFGGVLLGVDLQVAQQRQTTWDYTSGSGEWGGHAILAGRYNDPTGTTSDRLGVITWAEAVDTTRGFISHLEDEAWVVVWPEHLGSREFLEGVDVKALASAYEDLTGRPFPAVPTPPAPAPSPAPPADVDAALATALRRFLKSKLVPRYLRDAATAWLVGQ